MVILIGIATFFSTLLGGLFALRLKDRLHLILGFSAGAIIGVAFFDLMPEALEIGTKNHSPFFITSLIAVGFLTYLVLDRSVLLHGHHEEKDHLRRGSLGAGSLSIHSFLDGAGIGLAFKVSPGLGVIVAAAVLTHDFSDGINTVSFIIKNKGERDRALRWLFVDAAAPVVGILSTLFFVIQESTLGLLLALFSGFFLYIGASDLLPESHHAHPVMWTTFMTVVGMGTLYVVTRLAMI
ncbi:MAG TPA: ZIP family metal transporter [Nitrospiria bacterium]|jgi:ZIP family zinc transporter|nr:ZIP family metal transporter [Nitrospiria bacterium]